jgi:hypothetical protein
MTKQIDVAKAIMKISWSEFRDMSEEISSSIKGAREDDNPWALESPDQVALLLWSWAEGYMSDLPAE